MVKLARKGNTQVLVQGETIQVILYGSVIVAVNDHRIILDSHGWRTATTKQRMNQASMEFGLGYRVYQENWQWYVNQYVNHTIVGTRVFHDGMGIMAGV